MGFSLTCYGLWQKALHFDGTKEHMNIKKAFYMHDWFVNIESRDQHGLTLKLQYKQKL